MKLTRAGGPVHQRLAHVAHVEHRRRLDGVPFLAEEHVGTAERKRGRGRRESETEPRSLHPTPRSPPAQPPVPEPSATPPSAATSGVPASARLRRGKRRCGRLTLSSCRPCAPWRASCSSRPTWLPTVPLKEQRQMGEEVAREELGDGADADRLSRSLAESRKSTRFG